MELGHVDPDADRHVIRAADHVLEVQPVLVHMAVTVDLLLAAEPVAVDVESDTRGVAGELADAVQLREHRLAVKAVPGGEVEVVGEAGSRQVALAQCIAALQGRPARQAGLPEDPADDPAEQVDAARWLRSDRTPWPAPKAHRG